MVESTPLLRSVLVSITLGVAVAWAIAFRVVLGKKGHGWNVAMTVWLGLTWFVASRGLLSFDAMPPKFPIVVTIGLIIATMAARSRDGLALALETPLWFLIGFQAMRIPIELFLHRAYTEGIIGAQMTYAGMNFDIVTGVTGLLLGIWSLLSSPPRWLLWAWNIMGMVLLVTIVTIAILSTPLVNAFPDAPPNVFVTREPFIWLPAFLVAMAWFGHLLVWRRLNKRAA